MQELLKKLAENPRFRKAEPSAYIIVGIKQGPTGHMSIPKYVRPSFVDQLYRSIKLRCQKMMETLKRWCEYLAAV